MTLGKSLFFLAALVLMAVNAVVGQRTGEQEWQTYSPDKAPFSMKIPGAPSPAQGHVFDPASEGTAHRLFADGLKSKIFNFEIRKGATRQFLVSVLAIETAKSRKPKPISKRQAEMIDMAIGDGIISSRIETVSKGDGQISQWSYKREGRLNQVDEERGRVYIKRSNDMVVIVVVDYDYAEPDDPDIAIMLNSLSLRKKR